MTRRTILKTSMGCVSSAAVSAQDKPYSIFLTFSWSFSNIGDIAITPGILRLLQKHIPNHRVTLVVNTAIEKYRDYLGTRFPAVQLLATPFNSPQPRSKEFREAFDHSDMLLFSSGTTLSYGRWDRDWNRTLRYALALIMAREAKKPYGIYCHSFDPIKPPAEILMVPVLSDAKFIFTRDGESLNYIRQLGVRSPTMEFGPDSTFGFDLRDEPWADEFLRKYRLQPRKFISVVIRSKIQGFIDDRREQLHAGKMREIIRRYVERTGENVLICPEVVLEIEPARRLIYDPLPEKVKESVRFSDQFWLPEQAFSVFARARAHVSMDMHSVIMALAAGTPIVHPRFVEAGIKAWMLRDLGISEWLFDIDNDPVDSVASAVEAIHSDYGRALAKVKAVNDLVHKRQAETMAVVRRTLAASRGIRLRGGE